MRIEKNLQKALLPYIIEGAMPMVVNRLESINLRLDFSQRASRVLGYYKHSEQTLTPIGDDKKYMESLPTISLQINLNPYALLLVFIHEWAHLLVRNSFPQAAAHGKEWKSVYAKEAICFLRADIFPKDLLQNLHLYFEKPSAKWDLRLQQACAPYGKSRTDFISIYNRSIAKNIILPAPQTIRDAMQKIEPKNEQKNEAKAIVAQKVYQQLELKKVAELTLPIVVKINDELYTLDKENGDYKEGWSLKTKKPIRVHAMTFVMIMVESTE